jgi:HD superfamily phosphodiesterase
MSWYSKNMVDLKTYQAINTMIGYNGKDQRRIQHALKVFAYAQFLCEGEKCADPIRDIVEYAAILHDIGIHEAEEKYHSTSAVLQELEGPPVARELLHETGIEEEVIERVCHLIGNHHSYDKIDTIDFQILVEADFLVNIYEEDMEQSAVESLRSTIFKTQTGIALLDSMYKTGVK